MLMIRHAIGSRLFLQTEDYTITPEGEKWIITAGAKLEELDNLLAFKEELNLFVVGENEKTWYYSSDGEIEKTEAGNIQIIADHKTIYPV